MPSNRDLLDAQRFNRARLVTAFTSGLPGGRELEPRSGMAPLIVGVVLTAVMIAVALIVNRLSPKLPGDWQNDYLIVIKNTGARYFSVDGVLRPVTNITSAKLLAPSGSFKVKEVAASVIAGIPRGAQVGLTDAPDDVPAPSSLITDPWTACAPADVATHTWIPYEQEGLAPAQMALVSNQNTTFLIAGNLFHPLTSTTATLTALDLVDAAVHPVRADWLNLLKEASPVGPLFVTGAGQPTQGMPSALSGAVVGSLVEVPHDDGTTKHYVVSDATHLVELSDVGYSLYLIGTGADPGLVGNPIQATLADVAALVVPNQGTIPEDWPPSVNDTVPTGSIPCVQRPMTGTDQAVSLQQIPAAVTQTMGVGQVTVRGGGGVLMAVSNGGTLQATRLIDDSGVTNGIGSPSDTLTRLGYSATDVVAVPQPWAALVPPRNANAPALSNATAEATVT